MTSGELNRLWNQVVGGTDARRSRRAGTRARGRGEGLGFQGSVGPRRSGREELRAAACVRTGTVSISGSISMLFMIDRVVWLVCGAQSWLDQRGNIMDDGGAGGVRRQGSEPANVPPRWCGWAVGWSWEVQVMGLRLFFTAAVVGPKGCRHASRCLQWRSSARQCGMRCSMRSVATVAGGGR